MSEAKLRASLEELLPILERQFSTIPPAPDSVAWQTAHGRLIRGRVALSEEDDGLEEKIENARIAASETQPSWKHRCHHILSALGLDYGDPDWEMPEEKNTKDQTIRMLREALRQIGQFRGQLDLVKDGNLQTAVAIADAAYKASE